MPLTEAQKLLRLSGVSASDVPALCDLYPATWKNRRTAEDVFREKMGEDGFAGSPRTERGDWLEDPIARRWALETGRQIERNATTHRHPEMEWALATPDYYVLGDPRELLEIKLVGGFGAKAWADGPPHWVAAQCQFQMGVTGHKRVHVAALIEGDRDFAGPRSYPVEFNPEVFQQLVVIASRFWQRVLDARAA